MKKPLIKILISIGCLVILFGMVVLGQITYIHNCSYKIGSRVVVDRDNNTISVNDDEDFRILQLSDTQISGLGDSLKSFGYIKRIVEKASPDIIVLMGDNIMDDSKKGMLNRFIKFFDEFEIPWATVMGNHDYAAEDIPMDYQSELYEKSKYSLFERGSVENSYGNYYYNILRDGKPTYTLIFMDNAISIEKKHIDWYSDIITKNSNNDKDLPSMLFFHKPLRDTYFGYWNAVYFESPIDGEKREGVAYVYEDAGIFNKALELGSTRAMIYGHNHRNNFIIDYHDIKMCFGLKSTRAAYHDRDLIGGNVYVLKSDNTLSIERVYV